MTLQQMRERMHTHGWCIIGDVIPPSEVDAVRASVLDTVDRYRHTRVDAPSHIGAVTGLLRYDQSFAPYLAEARLLALAAALLGPGLRISYHSSVVNYPGNEPASGTPTGRPQGGQMAHQVGSGQGQSPARRQPHRERAAPITPRRGPPDRPRRFRGGMRQPAVARRRR